MKKACKPYTLHAFLRYLLFLPIINWVYMFCAYMFVIKLKMGGSHEMA